MCVAATSGCAGVYFTVHNCIEYSSTASLFQAQDVWKHTRSSGVAGTAKKRQLLYYATFLFKI